MRQTLFEDGRHRDRDLFLRFGLLERRRLGCLRGGLLLRARDDCDSLEGKGFFWDVWALLSSSFFFKSTKLWGNPSGLCWASRNKVQRSVTNFNLASLPRNMDKSTIRALTLRGSSRILLQIIPTKTSSSNPNSFNTRASIHLSITGRLILWISIACCKIGVKDTELSSLASTSIFALPCSFLVQTKKSTS